MADKEKISSSERAELIAFLDGEVDPAVADRVETRLAQSPAVRSEARALRESYDLLDFLPMPKTTREFTRRTAVFVAHGVKQPPRTRHRKLSRAVRATAYLCGLLLAFLLGWWGVSALPDPQRSLLEDLPVIERLQEYRASRDVEFLRALRDQQILDKADTNRLTDSSSPSPDRSPQAPDSERSNEAPDSKRSNEAPDSGRSNELETSGASKNVDSSVPGNPRAKP